MNKSELTHAYKSTQFWVEPNDGVRFAIQCDAPNSLLDALLSQHGHTHWSYITACNPRSRILAAEENATRMNHLRRILQDRQFTVFEGIGEAHDAEWPPELSFLVLGIPMDDAVSLGRAFDQNAILAGCLGQAPQLLWINPQLQKSR